MAKLYVVGIGPGGREHMTLKAIDTIKKSELIVGYKGYMDYISDLIEGKEVFSTGMKGEIERCKFAIESVKNGKNTSIISTGDAGLYGMAGPILELSQDQNIEVEIIPGVSASFTAAAELGAPIMHDHASISLSDLLTPWTVIENRLEMAAKGDFVISIYNPKSKGRKNHLENAINIIKKHRDLKTPVAIVKNAGREDNSKIITDIEGLDYDLVDMFCVLLIGNSNTYVKNNKMITPRGYEIK